MARPAGRRRGGQHHALRRVPGLRGGPPPGRRVHRSGRRARRAAAGWRAGAIAAADEHAQLAGLAGTAAGLSWDRLLFSAKESVYKAWYPLTGRWLGFDEATVTIGPADGTFTAEFGVPGPVLRGRRLTGFSGRWLAARGLVLTAIAVPPA